MYFDEDTVRNAVRELRGSADHLVKIWFVLKAMGLTENRDVIIDTSNSTPFLTELFRSGEDNGDFFVPFSHTARFAKMKSDAARSIIQTNIQRWATSGSVVTVDPSSFLKIEENEEGKLIVKTQRQYPLGLGFGKNGFAIDDNKRVSIPEKAFAVWYFAQEDVSDDIQESVKKMKKKLNISLAESNLIFTDVEFNVHYSDNPITDKQLANICKNAFNEGIVVEVLNEEKTEYIRRVKNMVTVSDSPSWVNIDPEVQLKSALDMGEKAVLLYGPPRTGKTRGIDSIIPRESADRISIQMHEGWGYENLIMGIFPKDQPGRYDWKPGTIVNAVREGKKYIIIEELNRTRASQALGEVFSLIENRYRGQENKILLPDESEFYIPDDITFIFTMNNVDASTEDIDDALIGRLSSINFPPRIESLDFILTNNGVESKTKEKIKEVFNVIQTMYPLGHGYFANYKDTIDFKLFYLMKIRPVLSNHFEAFRPENVAQIDNLVDELFAKGE